MSTAIAAIKQLEATAVKTMDSHQDEILAQRREIEGVKERVEMIEARKGAPGVTALPKEQAAHMDAFKAWMRDPHNDSKRMQLSQLEADYLKETKATINTGTGAQGGFAVPAEIDARIEARVRQLNPFRQIANVTAIGTSDYSHLVSMGDGASGWVAELGARAQTTEPTLRERKPTMGTVYAFPWASEESVQDIFFDVGNWLVTEASDEFAAQEATAIISGNGTNRPTGFLNSAPTDESDDSLLRAAGVLQYVPGGHASLITADALIDLAVGAIKERYLADPDGVAWVMSRSTLAAVRKLKSTGGGDYLWQPSMAGGTPSTLLGYPVFTCDAMPAVAANAHPIAFGNFRRGYLLVDRGPTRITVDDSISAPGVTKFYIRRRTGGCVLANDSLKVLKVATS